MGRRPDNLIFLVLFSHVSPLRLSLINGHPVSTGTFAMELPVHSFDTHRMIVIRVNDTESVIFEGIILAKSTLSFDTFQSSHMKGADSINIVATHFLASTCYFSMSHTRIAVYPSLTIFTIFCFRRIINQLSQIFYVESIQGLMFFPLADIFAAGLEFRSYHRVCPHFRMSRAVEYDL
jgi:hypothetical protein